MKKFMPRMNEKGFSLVELMIVVGIIGVLATLALPRFKQFQAKAKMGEARNMLSHVYTLQQSYSIDNNRFLAFALMGRNAAGTIVNCAGDGNANLLGFRIEPCTNGGSEPTPRYGYDSTGTQAAFVATATSGAGVGNLVCPGNNAHSFTINQANAFNETNAVVGTVCAQ